MAEVSRLAAFESQLDGKNTLLLSGRDSCVIRDLITYFEEDENHLLLSSAEQAWQKTRDPFHQGCILFLAVSTTEKMGQFDERRKWLRRRMEVCFNQNSYFKWLFLYQDALSAYFDSYFWEAEVLFKKCLSVAEESGYEMGAVRAWFHLAMIAKWQKKHERAESFFKNAWRLASLCHNRRWQQRVKLELGSQSFSNESILECLRKKDCDGARRALADLEKSRRKTGVTRKARSYYCYLPAIFFLRGRKELGRNLLLGISDPYIQMLALDICLAAGIEVDFCKSLLAFNRLKCSPPSPKHEEDFDFAKIKNLDVRNLLKTFLSRAGVLSKPEITEIIWKIPYDPILHENKIHKLIHRARLQLEPHLKIRNCYGSYELIREDKI